VLARLEARVPRLRPYWTCADAIHASAHARIRPTGDRIVTKSISAG